MRFGETVRNNISVDIWNCTPNFVEAFIARALSFLPSVLAGVGVTAAGAVPLFLSSGGTGQPAPQLPHLPWPPTCVPLASTSVEHQALCSVRWAWFHVHSLCTTPLNLNGKMHGFPFAAPDTVTHILSAKEK